jgi:hypothetical protein
MPLDPDNYHGNQIPDGVHSGQIVQLIVNKRDGSRLVSMDTGDPQIGVVILAGGRRETRYVTLTGEREGLLPLLKAVGVTTAELGKTEAVNFLDQATADRFLLNRTCEVAVTTKQSTKEPGKTFRVVVMQTFGTAHDKRAKAAGEAPVGALAAGSTTGKKPPVEDEIRF